MFSLLSLRVLHSPCYDELSVDSKLEYFFSKKQNKTTTTTKKNPEDFSKHIVWDGKMYNFFLGANVLLFDVLPF